LRAAIETSGVGLIYRFREEEDAMTKFWLVGATALSLTLAVPALAGDVQPARTKGHVRTAVAPANANNVGENLPIENALRWGYSQGYSYYPSGFGGLYGDGRYPGNTISNANHPYLHP
jgi:hypothetical protein